MGTYTKKWVLFLTKHQLKWEFKNGKIDMLGGFWLPAYFFALIDGGAGAFFCCILPDFLPALPVLSCVIPGLHEKNTCYTGYAKSRKRGLTVKTPLMVRGSPDAGKRAQQSKRPKGRQNKAVVELAG